MLPTRVTCQSHVSASARGCATRFAQIRLSACQGRLPWPTGQMKRLRHIPRKRPCWRLNSVCRHPSCTWGEQATEVDRSLGPQFPEGPDTQGGHYQSGHGLPGQRGKCQSESTRCGASSLPVQLPLGAELAHATAKEQDREPACRGREGSGRGCCEMRLPCTLDVG